MSKIFLWQWNPVKNIWYFLLSMKIRICKSLHFLIFVKSNFCIFSSVFVAFYSASTFNSNRYVATIVCMLAAYMYKNHFLSQLDVKC